MTSGPALFALHTARDLAQTVAAALGIEQALHEERDFDFGEHKCRPLVPVRNRDVYVLGRLSGDPQASANDRLLRMLFFIGALKDAGAACITAVCPYLPYARKDRRTKAGDPVTTRYVAAIFEAVGVDRMVALDVHNLAAFENAFRIPTVPLASTAMFLEHIRALGGNEWTVASPDVGGIKRAQQLRGALEAQLKQPVGTAFMDKQRSAGVVSGESLVGTVQDRRVMIVDDMISSGTTMRRAVRACRQAGAREVYVAATHAVFTADAMELFDSNDRDQTPDSVAVTNSVPLTRDFASCGTTLKILDIAPLLATVIARLHAGESVDALCGLEGVE